MNVIAAESDDEARRLATTQQMSFANIFRGTRTLSQPPIDDIDSYWSPQEKMQASQMLACSVIGSPETVRRGLKDMIERTRSEEHTSELQSLMRISYAVFCLKKKKTHKNTDN